MTEEGASRTTISASGRRIYLVRVARIQRVLILLIAVYLGLYAAAIAAGQSNIPPALVIVLALGMLGCLVAAIVLTIMLAHASGGNIVLAILGGIVMLAPCIGLLVLVMVNQRAVRLIQGAGVTVGFLGVSRQDMNKLVEGACAGCGYDLRGLPGGVCPECGRGFAAAGVPAGA